MNEEAITQLTYLTRNDRVLKRLSEEAIPSFVYTFYIHQYIYDPYQQEFFNPLLNLRYKSRKIDGHSIISLTSLLNSNSRVAQEHNEKVSLNEASVRIRKRNNLHYTVIYKIIRRLKWAGLIAGTLTAIFYNIYLGGFIGLFLIYLDYNFYDRQNTTLAKYQSSFLVASDWFRKRKIYLFLTIVLLIFYSAFLYCYTKNIWFTFSFMLLARSIIDIYVIKSLSAVYWSTEGLIHLKESIEDYNAITTFPSESREAGQDPSSSIGLD